MNIVCIVYFIINCITNMDSKIYELLSRKEYYSLGINSLAKRLGVTVSYLESLDFEKKTVKSIDFYLKFGDYINIFTYNNVRYIGLESRRIAYEVDKLNGCNWVENAIKAGKYD